MSNDHPLSVVWDDDLADYDFGPGHPLAPVRVQLTIELARAIGVFEHDNVTVIAPAPIDDDQLLTVHDADYVAAVQAERPSSRYGLGTADVPVFGGMHVASRRVAGATVAAAKAVLDGVAVHGVNVAGGLHHAMPGAASGFCVYNDPAIAIRWLLDHGVDRIAYVDIDVHHGDGVQEIFYDDARVLTISLHQNGRTLFPGTGFPEDVGGPRARGYAVNLALPPGTADAGWLRAFHAVVPPLVREFRPTVLVSQHGCDSHRLDPLAQLALSVDGQRAAAVAIHNLAHQVCDGRWVATGGGGYALAQVVPRTWTHLLAEAAGHPIEPTSPTPKAWQDLVVARTGATPPITMTDDEPATYADFAGGRDPANPVDRAIVGTMRAVFPYHGIDVSDL
ncbi:MAG TPA: acetoin utilization protein AcuC [Acidothermaceae bacterium]